MALLSPSSDGVVLLRRRAVVDHADLQRHLPRQPRYRGFWRPDRCNHGVCLRRVVQSLAAPYCQRIQRPENANHRRAWRPALRKRPSGDRTLNKPGKQAQYCIGTITTLKHAHRLICCLTYCGMDAQKVAHSTRRGMEGIALAMSGGVLARQ